MCFTHDNDDVNPHYLIEHFVSLIDSNGAPPAPATTAGGEARPLLRDPHARGGGPTASERARARGPATSHGGRQRAQLHAHVVPPVGASCERYEAARSRGFFMRCARGLGWASTLGEHAIGALWSELDAWAWEQPWYRYAPRREPDFARRT